MAKRLWTKRHPFYTLPKGDREQETLRLIAIFQDVTKSVVERTVARNKAVELNMGLVYDRASRLATGNDTQDVEDMASEGAFGLMRAVDLFDLESKTKFSTYAEYWINNFLYDYISENRTPIHVPSYLTEALRKWRRFAKKQLENFDLKTGIPSEEDLKAFQKHYGFTDKRMNSIRAAMMVSERRCYCSCNTTDDNGDFFDIPFRDVSVEDIEKNDLYRAVIKRFSMLKDKDREIVCLYFGVDENGHATERGPLATNGTADYLKSIGRADGNSRQMVTKIISRAVGVLAGV